MPEILIDADGCPVKDEVYRVAERYGLPVVLVANTSLRIPPESWIRLEIVGNGFDAADDWIAERAGPRDIVITSDIPLAARCIAKGAGVLSPKGRILDETSIGDVLASRDLLTSLRASGMTTSGPEPFEKRDRSRFLERLDALIHALIPPEELGEN